MEQQALGLVVQFKDLGVAAVLAISAIGSALGIRAAGLASVGAWKKCYLQNRVAPFLLIVFIGAPLSQTIYGMILMNKIAEVAVKGTYLWSLGILGGIPIALSAYGQGMIGAAGADAMAETGKGFTNYLIALGIIETVALFVMVFLLGKITVLAGM